MDVLPGGDETEIGEIEHKLLDQDKYITVNDFNKLLGAIFDQRLKEAKLATNNDFNTVEQHAIRNKKKIEQLQIFELSYFLGKNYFGDDGFQNMFAYRKKLNKLVSKEGKGNEYVIACKSRGLYKQNFIDYIMLSCLT